MRQGWAKIHRKIQDDWIWQDKPFSRGQAWIDLILMANHSENKAFIDGKLIDVERGQLITSTRKLSEKWGWSRTKVVDFLKVLSSDKKIIVKSDTKKTVITIINYSLYQDREDTEMTLKRHQNDTEKTLKSHRNDTEMTQKSTNKNVKKDKNVKNEKKKTYTPVVKFLVDEYFKTLTEDQRKRFEVNREKYHDCCDKLMRIDSYSEEEIRKAINFARHDNFWSPNFLSFTKLRNKNKDGVMYVEVFLNNARQGRKRNAPPGDAPRNMTKEQKDNYYKSDLKKGDENG